MLINIFDLDNCVSDDAHRRHLINKKFQDPYIEYHSLMIMDEAANSVLLEQSEYVWFLTGRPSKYREFTEHWIQKKFPFLADRYDLYMRPANMRYVIAPELKTHLYWVAKDLTKAPKNAQVMTAYDDRLDNLKAFSTLGLPVERLMINNYDDTGWLE
jgi:hypothetical protein